MITVKSAQTEEKVQNIIKLFKTIFWKCALNSIRHKSILKLSIFWSRSSTETKKRVARYSAKRTGQHKL